MKIRNVLMALALLIVGTMATNAKEQKKIAALTFDDGPNVVTTPKVLDVLGKEQVKATFFLCGKGINEQTEPVMRRAVKMGCELENHSRTHSYMDKQSDEEIKEEIAYTNAAIKRVVGKNPKYFRPPYIAIDDRMYDLIDMTFICGFNVEDWNPEVSAQKRAEGVLKQVKDGDVILLHDFEYNENTVKALETIIPQMKKMGYEFVTIEELFKQKKIKTKKHARIIYSNALQTK